MTGSGTLLDPYVIWDVVDLQNINLDLAANYELAHDIEAFGFAFVPLGTFTGTLDGKRHKVTNLTITRNGAGIQCASLFLRNDGVIRNLGIDACVITAISTNNDAEASPLVHDNRGEIDNCWATGTVTASNGAGWAWSAGSGLVNINNCLGAGGRIRKCHANVGVTITSIGYASASGLVDDNWGDINESYAEGNVSATSSSLIRPVYAAGFVARNGYDWVGYEGIIGDSYARGNATATGGVTASAGGFVAEQDMASSMITNAYSTGIPIADDVVGGFCAVRVAGTMVDSYWDAEASGQGASDGGIGKTTAEMKSLATFLDAGWDIEGRATDKNDGYPYLAWQSTWYIFVAVAPPPPPISVVTLAATEIR